MDIAGHIEDNGPFIFAIRTGTFGEAKFTELCAQLAMLEEKECEPEQVVGIVLIMVEVIMRRHSEFNLLDAFYQSIPDRFDWDAIKDKLLSITSATSSKGLGTWLVSSGGKYARALPIVMLLEECTGEFTASV